MFCHRMCSLIECAPCTLDAQASCQWKTSGRTSMPPSPLSPAPAVARLAPLPPLLVRMLLALVCEGVAARECLGLPDVGQGCCDIVSCIYVIYMCIHTFILYARSCAGRWRRVGREERGKGERGRGGVGCGGGGGETQV